MTKEELYQQIDQFKLDLAKRFDKRDIKEVDKFYYYVNNDEAKEKASFINFMIDEGHIDNSYNTILDMTFGSGNLTSHIVFDNDIAYETIYLNDKNIEKTNQDIKHYIYNCSILDYDILEDGISNDISADLVILNPQLSGSYVEGDLYQQRQENEKNQDVLNRLAINITTYLGSGTTIVFYGQHKDFIALFGECNYIRYRSNSQQLYIVKNEFKEQKCFQRSNDSFVETDCYDTNTNDSDEALDFDDLTLEIDKFEKLEQSINKEKEKIETIKFSDEPKGKENWKEDFTYKNILFKGVPGTGKSRAINEIVTNHLGLAKNDKNALRINIHSASSNSDLMQGIGISSENGNIKYSEKQGLILDIIKRATFHPYQPFVLILEEIQENSLNELIGDLIYLIEDDKRAKLAADNEEYDSYEDLINKLVDKDDTLDYVEIPYLVNDSTKYKKMIMPDNLYIFCTSNYRDDKKVIEDNLLRRFEVIEIYPSADFEEFQEYAKEFFQSLNTSILKVMKENHEIHPDRFMIGHAIWQNVNDEQSFYKSFLKLVVEFKDIREIEFDTFKNIIEKVTMPHELKTYNSYYEMIKDLQNKIGYDFLN